MALKSVRTENEFGHKQRLIDDNLSLRILLVDNCTAELYFVDGKGNRIHIPVGLMVTNTITGRTIPRYSNTQTFALVWCESYIVTIDNVNVNGPLSPTRNLQMLVRTKLKMHQ